MNAEQKLRVGMKCKGRFLNALESYDISDTTGEQRLAWRVVGHETLCGVVYYNIDVYCNDQHVCRCNVRYKVLEAFHKAFSLDRYTKFPPKHVLNRKKKDPSFLTQRQQELARYFSRLEPGLDITESNNVLQYFIEISKIPQ